MAAVVEVEVATKEWMVLPDTLAGLVVEVMAIPTTALLEPEDVIELALLFFFDTHSASHIYCSCVGKFERIGD